MSAPTGWAAANAAADPVAASTVVTTTPGATTAATTGATSTVATTTTTSTTTTSTTTTSATTSTTSATTSTTSATAPRRHHSRRRHHKRARTHGSPSVAGSSSSESAHRTRPTSSSAGSPAGDSTTPSTNSPNALTSGLGSNASASTALEQLVEAAGAGDFPTRALIRIYEAAARRYHIQWEILAAINAIETNYGRDVSTSSAGAIGFMQFMPATWRQYAVAVDGAGKPNPYNPRDAVFAAAHLLAANGGMRNLRRALYAYNHASWYVDAVLWRARVIGDWASGRQRTDSGGPPHAKSRAFSREIAL